MSSFVVASSLFSRHGLNRKFSTRLSFVTFLSAVADFKACRAGNFLLMHR